MWYTGFGFIPGSGWATHFSLFQNMEGKVPGPSSHVLRLLVGISLLSWHTRSLGKANKDCRIHSGCWKLLQNSGRAEWILPTPWQNTGSEGSVHCVFSLYLLKNLSFPFWLQFHYVGLSSTFLYTHIVCFKWLLLQMQPVRVFNWGGKQHGVGAFNSAFLFCFH